MATIKAAVWALAFWGASGDFCLVIEQAQRRFALSCSPKRILIWRSELKTLIKLATGIFLR